LVGFSGTVDSAQMSILTPFLKGVEFLSIPNMKVPLLTTGSSMKINISLKGVVKYTRDDELKGKITEVINRQSK
jgi:hypothetical protein